jgi:peptidoglycan/xylan/chitin deacetylase (PgdA/CDA1 family)
VSAGRGGTTASARHERFRVALTFDAEHPDRPSAPGGSEALIEALRRLGIIATFFIQGRWAEAYPESARRIRDDGHLIGSHSHYHARMPLLSTRGLRTDIATAERVILKTTGVDPKPWFRCPFGAGSRDKRVQAIVREAGYRHTGWHVIGEDWPATRTAAQVEEAIVAGSIEHGDGAVALLHSWPDRTVGAIDGIARRLRERGATFVRLDQLRSVPEVGGEVDELALAESGTDGLAPNELATPA